ncbi:MAG: hypothetical protein K5694_03840 [Bacilli bacterium]|nr:hypothetical protein [Bacilli bacterium]
MSGEGEAILLLPLAAPVALGAAAVAGAAVGTAAIAAGAGMAAYGAAKGAVEMAKDLGKAVALGAEAIKDTFGDCVDELKDLSLKKVKEATKAYEKLREQLDDLDEAKKDEYLEKLIKAIDVKDLGLDEKALRKLPISQLADLASVSYHIEKADDILYTLEQENVDVSKEKQALEKLRLDIIAAAKGKGDFSSIDQNILDEIEKISKRLEKEQIASSALEPCKRDIMIIQSKLDDPYLGIFTSDLNSILESEKKDEAQEEIEKLWLSVVDFSVRARQIQVVSKSLGNLDKRIALVKAILSDDSIHVSEKIRRVEEQLALVNIDYKEIVATNEEVFKQKAIYEKAYLTRVEVRNRLGLEKQEYAFDPENPEDSIKRENELLDDDVKLLEKRERQKKLHKDIAEIMRRRGWMLVETDKVETDGNLYQTSTYHIENGNVVQFTTNDQGSLSYGTSGVKVAGFKINKQSIYDTQKKFCKQRQEIFDELVALGYQLDESWRDEPNPDSVFEIELTDMIPGMESRIRQAKIDAEGGNKALRKEGHTGHKED